MPSGYVHVKLTATSVGSPVHNDVGAAGFHVPLALALSYPPGGGIHTWARYVVAWLRPDGTLERVPSGVDPSNKVVIGRLSHFSHYVVAGGD